MLTSPPDLADRMATDVRALLALRALHSNVAEPWREAAATALFVFGARTSEKKTRDQMK